jgi:2-iminobutanoate/2-iminopropanoate deaminase
MTPPTLDDSMTKLPRKERIVAGRPPAAPYSPAMAFENLVFVSRQLPVDAATAEVGPGGIEPQTEQAITNVERVLAAAGSALANVLKATVYLLTCDDWSAMNAVYVRRMGDVLPARCFVIVAELAGDARIEIDAIAHR